MKLYHGTSVENAVKILREGTLRAFVPPISTQNGSDAPCICFTKDLGVARAFGICVFSIENPPENDFVSLLETEAKEVRIRRDLRLKELGLRLVPAAEVFSTPKAYVTLKIGEVHYELCQRRDIYTLYKMHGWKLRLEG